MHVIYADKERESSKMVINHKISKVSDQARLNTHTHTGLLENIHTAHMCTMTTPETIKSYTQEIIINTSQHT